MRADLLRRITALERTSPPGEIEYFFLGEGEKAYVSPTSATIQREENENTEDLKERCKKVDKEYRKEHGIKGGITVFIGKYN